MPIAFVSRLIAIGEFSFSISQVVFEVTNVLSTVRVSGFSVSVALVLAPKPVVVQIVISRPGVLTLAVLHVFGPLTNVGVLSFNGGFPDHGALSIALVVLPLAIVATSVLVGEDTAAILFAVAPHAIVGCIFVLPGHLALSVKHIVLEVSFVLAAILPSKGASALTNVVLPLAFIN